MFGSEKGVVRYTFLALATLLKQNNFKSNEVHTFLCFGDFTAIATAWS